MSYLITSVILPNSPRALDSVPIERPVHKDAGLTWVYVSFEVDACTARILWREERGSYGGTCPDCTTNLGPPYGEGFKLTCTCGRTFTSVINKAERMYQWGPTVTR